MPMVFQTKHGMKFVIWELKSKQFEQYMTGALALMPDKALKVNRKHVKGLCRMGFDPQFEIFLRVPYSLSTLTHEVYHAVVSSLTLKALGEEAQADTIGDLTQAIWDASHGKGAKPERT